VSADSNKGIKADTSISGAAIGTSDGSMGDILIENSIIVAEGGYYESTSHAAAIGIGYVGSTMGDIILKNSQITARNNGDGLASVIGAGANMHVYVTGTLGDIVITNTELNLSMEIGTTHYYAALIGSGVGKSYAYVNIGKIIFTDMKQEELDEVIPTWLPSDFNQYGAYALGIGYEGNVYKCGTFGGVWVSDGNGGTVQIGDESGYYIACKNGGFVHDFDEICGGTCSDCGVTYHVVHTMGTAATCIAQAVCDTCGASYGALDPNNHEYETNNGICCDTYQSATLNADGYYEIFNAGQLFWFAQQVNNGETTINAILMNDIVINSQVLDADGNLISDTSGLRQWTPIGHYNSDTDNLGFAGIFDGNGKTIRGLYHYGDTARYAGLFGYSSGMIQDLTIADSYIHTTHSDGRAGSVTGLNEGTVSNCSNYGIVGGVNQVGGIIGRIIAGLVENCTNYGTVNSTTHAGGICGCASGGTINNSYNTGSVKADSGVGGIAGSMQNTSNISNCISVGTVEGSSQAGGVVGYVLNNSTTNATITNCYHDNTVCGYDPVGVNGGSYASATVTSVEGKTSEQFASGEVAYLLGTAWGQTIDTEDLPVLGGQKVYKITVCGKTVYSNTDGDIPHDYDEKGFCTVTSGQTHYQPAVDSNSDGYYEIGNAGQLFWFANYINTVDRTASAVLTADIDLENRPWTPIGSTSENSNNFRGVFDGQNHTIKGLYVKGGRAGLGFFGEVRTGTVKNFTIYGNVVVNTDVNYVGGVIGSICGLNSTDHGLERNGAVIQNITSYVNLTAKVHGVGMIGGFVGYANHQSLIENCSWYGTFDAGIYRVDSGAGGFIGKIQENTSEVTIRNCAAYGTIKTNYAKNSYNNNPTIYMGGFLSFSNTNAQTVLENCLFAGKFERGANLTDEARLGAFGTLRSVNAIKNCYYLGDDGLEAVHSDSNLKPGDNIEITSVTGEQLLSGELAYKLQEANEIWGQTINSQNYPVLGGDTVYYGYTSCADDAVIGYTNNSNASTEAKPGHSAGAEGDKVATCAAPNYCHVCEGYYGEVDKTNHDETVTYENGFCPNCGVYEPAVLNGDVYEISNAGKLYWFAAQVNSGSTAIRGRLTDHITINPGTFTSDGTYTPKSGETVRVWTPIGNDIKLYIGIFDGNGKTISGLYYNNSSADKVGLFGVVGEGGTVQNVGVADSYICGNNDVGGVVGYNWGTVKNCTNSGIVIGKNYDTGGIVGDNASGTIMGCCSRGEVSGLLRVGGIAGYNSTGTVTACINSSKVSSIHSYVGGIVGLNFGGIVTDCYSRGEFSGMPRRNGGIVGTCFSETATVTNCYYLNTTASGGIDGADAEGQAEAKTDEQFNSGEVVYLLGSPFGQNIGTDAYPVLGGDTVYQVYNCENEVTYSNTNENLGHIVVNGICTVCGATCVAQVGSTGFQSVQAAVDYADGNTVLLVCNVDENVTTEGDLRLDLNGHTLTSVSVGGSFYGFDSSATVTAAGTGSVTVSGNVVKDHTANGVRYIALENEGVYTFHVLDMKLTAISLRTTEAGIYYKASVTCDPVLNAAISSYGVALSVNDMPGIDFAAAEGDCATYCQGTPVNGKAFTSGSVFGIFKEGLDNNAQRGQVKIYANAYIQLADNTVLMSDTTTGDKVGTEGFNGIAWSLQDVLVALDANYSNLNAAQQALMRNYYITWADAMSDWALPNLAAAAAQ